VYGGDGLGKRLTVGIVFGGRSGEHEVSLRSAGAVLDAIDRRKYDVVPLYIGMDGRWLNPADGVKMLPAPFDGRQSELLTKAGTDVVQVNLDSLFPTQTNGSKSTKNIDVLFPVLHGTYGEDGTIQGLFEMAGVPYVGCGVLASSCGMDKVVMKALFKEAGLPVCRYIWFLRGQWESNPDSVVRRVSKEIGFPCFVKPANLGSSVGVSRATDTKSLKRAIEEAAQFDRKIIVEEGLDVREIECAVIGNDEPTASLPGEYVVKEVSAAFLDYTEKYSNTGNVEFVVPAPLSKRETSQIQKMAATAFKALDCSGLSRVDFFVRKDNKEILINELNSLPGLTDVSGFPKMWAASGVGFTEMLDRLISFALDRFKERERNRTSR
jgi:D-alanine-D-alanine ligase